MPQLKQHEFTVCIPGAPPVRATSDLPPNVRDVLYLDEHEVRGDFSVTQLLDHPRCVLLKRMYPDMVLDDVSGLVSSTAGKALHHWFEIKLRGENVFTEQQVMIPVPECGVTVSGTADIVELIDTDPVRCIVSDLKHHKTWRWVSGDFTRLVWQLNLYYLGLTHRYPGIVGRTILRGLMPFTDWNRLDAARLGTRYPEKPFMVLETRPLPVRHIAGFVRDRVRRLLDFQGRPEVLWPDAGEEDVWQRTEAVKVYKRGGSRAVSGGVFKPGDYDTREQATAAATHFRDELTERKGGAYEIRVQKSDRRRCSAYCPVASMCTTYQNWLRSEAKAA